VVEGLANCGGHGFILSTAKVKGKARRKSTVGPRARALKQWHPQEEVFQTPQEKVRDW
jgi:hypothetical protein